jgi:hypothetical protein
MLGGFAFSILRMKPLGDGLLIVSMGFCQYLLAGGFLPNASPF